MEGFDYAVEELFLQCIATYLNNDSLTADIADESSWHALFSLAQEQKLLPVVYEQLHDSMPASIIAQYRPLAVLQVARQTAHTAEFLQVYHELLQSGFQPLVVKGIIARTAYDKPDLRISSDEDIYVPVSSYLRFHKTMRTLGFTTSDQPDLKNAHEERYFRNDLLIEGHWEFFPQDHETLNSLNSLSDGFWKRSQIIEIDRVPLRTLEPTDHMVFLLLHAFKHFISSGFGIRQICDIAQWSKAYEIDWSRAHGILQSVHGEYFVGALFGIGEQYFGMTFPDGWERADYTLLLSDALSAGIYGASTMSRKHSSTMTLGAVESGFRGRRSIPLLSSLFPNRSVMETSFPWVQKSSLLLPAAWIIRIVRYLKESRTDNSVAESIHIGKERTEMLRFYKIL